MKNKAVITMVVLVLAIAIAQAVSLVPVQAASSASIEKAVVSISGGRSSTACKTYVKCLKGTKRIDITMTLQKNNNGTWKNEKTWNGTKNATSYTLSNSKSVKGGAYRVKSTIKAYRNSGSETVTRYSSVAKY